MHRSANDLIKPKRGNVCQANTCNYTCLRPGGHFAPWYSAQSSNLFKTKGVFWQESAQLHDCLIRSKPNGMARRSNPATGQVSAETLRAVLRWKSFYQLTLITPHRQLHLHKLCCAWIDNNISSQFWEKLSKANHHCLSRGLGMQNAAQQVQKLWLTQRRKLLLHFYLPGGTLKHCEMEKKRTISIRWQIQNVCLTSVISQSENCLGVRHGCERKPATALELSSECSSNVKQNVLFILEVFIILQGHHGPLVPLLNLTFSCSFSKANRG